MKKEILQLGGPHLHNCPWCKIDYYGRRNQIYCCEKHRKNADNKRKAELNEILSTTIKRLKHNYKQLLKYLPESNGQWISLSDLLREGFHLGVPVRRIKSKVDGHEYETNEDLAYRINENGTQIIIKQWKKL